MNAPIHVTAGQVRALVAMLAGEDDEQLKLDMLEGETDLFKLVGTLLDGIEEDDGNIASLADQMNHRKDRKAAAEHRNEKRREAIAALMRCADLSKLSLPEATISVRKVPPKLIVNDEGAVPDQFCKTTRSPDMAAIKAEMDAGRAVSGVAKDNGGVALTIRRK